MPLVYLLYIVFQMFAFLPPSSYGMTLYGKIYNKNAHGSGSLILKKEGIRNTSLIFNKRVSIMAIASKRGTAHFSEICINNIYIRQCTMSIKTAVQWVNWSETFKSWCLNSTMHKQSALRVSEFNLCHMTEAQYWRDKTKKNTQILISTHRHQCILKSNLHICITWVWKRYTNTLQADKNFILQNLTF